jgi:hypothetical protein
VIPNIEVHISRLARSGWTLVVVMVGAEVYGAAHLEPHAALDAAAARASVDLALRGLRVDPDVIVGCAGDGLRSRANADARTSCAGAQEGARTGERRKELLRGFGAGTPHAGLGNT